MITTEVRGTPTVARRTQRRGAAWTLATVSLLLATTAATADPIVVFDNFRPPNNGFAAFEGQLMNNLNSPPRDYDIANSFIPSATGYVSDIWSAFALQSGPNEIDLFLMADDNGNPGQVLEAWHATGQMGLRGGFGAPVHFLGDQSTLIEAGQQYWLVSSATLPSVSWWMYNVQGDFGAVRRSVNGGPWTVWSDQRRGAFRVSVVPEPATLCLLACSALALVGRRRTRSTRL